MRSMKPRQSGNYPHCLVLESDLGPSILPWSLSLFIVFVIVNS
jgi:hypothetical protein